MSSILFNLHVFLQTQLQILNSPFRACRVFFCWCMVFLFVILSRAESRNRSSNEQRTKNKATLQFILFLIRLFLGRDPENKQNKTDNEAVRTDGHSKIEPRKATPTTQTKQFIQTPRAFSYGFLSSSILLSSVPENKDKDEDLPPREV